MSQMDSRRLVRALMVGALVFLLVGGGAGLVAAERPSAQGDAGPVLAAPHPGDRAAYSIEAVVVDDDLADPELGIGSTTLDVQWRTPRMAWTAADRMQMADVLDWTVQFGSGRHAETHAHESFLSGGGVPVAQLFNWSAQYSAGPDLWHQAIGGMDPRPQGTEQGTATIFEGPLVPCGFRSDLQGKAIQEGATAHVYGGCSLHDLLPDHEAKVTGWTTLHGRRVVVVAVEGDARVYYDPSLPVPVRIEAGMPETFGASFRLGRMFRADLQTFHPGSAPSPDSVPGPALEATVSSLTARTNWLVDDSTLDHAFPLSKAYAAALDPKSYNNPEDRSQTVPDFLASHPHAYLGFAIHIAGRDSAGLATYPGWALAWTDGKQVLGKVVESYPSAIVADVPSAGRPTVVQAWDPGFPEDVTGLLPAVEDLPAQVADLRSVWDRATQMLGQAPDSYGALVYCDASVDCSAPVVEVLAGTNVAFAGLWAEDYVRDQSQAQFLLGVGQDGRTTRVLEARNDLQAPVAVLPPAEGPPAQAAGLAAATTGALWALPSAPAAAGLSLLALLASALYYFWPAAKGSAMGLFSRIAPEDVLEHPARQQLLALIEANPGIHFQDVARRAGFGRGQLEHHLRKLEKSGHVSRVHGGVYTCFFAKGHVDRRVMAVAPVLRADGARRLLLAVEARPGASSRELAAHIGMANGTVSYHAKRLQDSGLLQSTGGAFHITDAGRQAKGLAS